MNKQLKARYLELIQARYKKSDKKTKKRVLDEFCKVCGYNRKYAIGLLQKPVSKALSCKPKSGRKPVYHDADLLKVLWRIWLETELACGKRLKVAIPLWLPFYDKHYGELNESTRSKLIKMSAATIDRALKPLRDKLTIKKRRATTKPGTLKYDVPLKYDTHWDVTQPGYVEADTVAHCGASMKGNFAWSVTVTDIKTTWTENRAIWNKGAYELVKQIRHIEQTLPFRLFGFNSDSGAEFINAHLVRYFAEPRTGQRVIFSRSRPYQKNDNAHVEQKNWTHVRQLLGYVRIDNPYTVNLMNDLYTKEWRDFQNYFMPSRKLIEKKRIGARYYRNYDQPQTPYQRLIKEPSISDEQKEILTHYYQTLDPFALRKILRIKRKRILESLKLISKKLAS
jgi:hypothetical protein